MRRLGLLVTLFAVTSLAQPMAPVDYRIDDVRRTVQLITPAHSVKAAKGESAHSGDRITTGWFSYALISSPKHRARFEVFSNSDVSLATGQPGVILSLERGRIHAMFDKVTGSEPRLVRTPGALLAVRGTQYLAEVDGKGRTTVDVYEGIVEIRSSSRAEPLLVHAGESSTFGRQQAPSARPTPPDRQHGGDRATGDGRGSGPNGAPGSRDPRNAPGAQPGGGGMPAPDFGGGSRGGPQPSPGGAPPNPPPGPPH